METVKGQAHEDVETDRPTTNSTEMATADKPAGPGEDPPQFKPSWRVLSIIVVLSLLSFMAAVDSTIVTTSLPTITGEIGGADLYAWIANSYLFACTAPQPFYAQVANVVGRKNPMLVGIAFFALGSGLAGGAGNPTVMIVGRTIQGLGSGGLYVLSDIIVCDIIPPRSRGPYLSVVLGMAAVGSTIGPILGGAIVAENWRWIFWINLPISAVGLIAILFFLDTNYKRSPTWLHALARIDFAGNAIFIPSMVSIYFALISGGVQYPWNSWRIIMPFVLGICGWIAFHVYQASRFCKEPTMPPRLFKHRTSAGGYLAMFLSSITLMAFNYFLPLYFLAVLGVSPLTSGVYYLPFALGILPFGGMSGAILSKLGVYRPLHWAGFTACAVGFGLLSTLSESSITAAWVCFQLIVSAGAGMIFTAALPTTLAPLPESDVAVATGTYSFVRSFGMVWGLTIASATFDNQINAHLDLIDDLATRSLLVDGQAYSFATGPYMSSLPASTKAEVVHVFVAALRVVWLVMAAVSCVGFFSVFIQKHVPLRKEHETEFGVTEKSHERSGAEKA
ncbi:MFS general substrate transporter [Thozetella sp. PMI_491]|nr:MFS general substrate transporter [Thozetella sp. PMI_491]